MSHSSSPETDHRLGAIGANLPNWIAEDVLPPAEGVREAAVSLVVRASNGRGLDMLLIKRATSERDPWSGHMALPGGRREETDATLLETAVRETWEETALDLTGAVVLGRLELVAPLSARLPKVSVTPIVFGVEGEAEASANSHEVAAVHWVGLDELRNPTSRESTTILLPDGPKNFPCFRLDGQIVWGLTHRILDRFLNHL